MNNILIGIFDEHKLMQEGIAAYAGRHRKHRSCYAL